MRFFLRILKYAGYALLALVALATGAAAVFTLTEAGRGGLAAIASGLASSPGRQVRISGLDGLWSGDLTVREVVVEDGDGPWLAVRDIEIEWSPSALLGLTFSADRVHAGRVEVARLPKSGDRRSASSSGLPVGLDIRSIDLPDIALSGVLAGNVARLSASGAVKVGGAPVAVDADLALTRTDGHKGSLKAKLAYLPDDNRLELQLRGSEPSGGVIANLLALPGTPAVAFTAEGSGPVSNWSGKATFSVNGEDAAEVSARHQLTDGGSRIEAKGTGDFAPFLPQSIAGIASGTTDFEFNGTFGAGGATEIETARLTSEAFSAIASGKFDPGGLSDLSVKAQSVEAPVALSFGEQENRIVVALKQASLRLFGPGDALGVNATAELASAGTAEHRADEIVLTATSDAFDIARQAGRLDVAATAQSAGSVNELIAGIVAGRVELTAAIDFSGQEIGFETSKVATGSMTASAKGSFARDTGALSADLEAKVLAAVLPAAARAPLDRTVNLAAHIERKKDGTFEVSGLDARSGAVQLTGDATYGGELLAAELSGTLSDVSRVSPSAAGELAFSAKVGGAVARPNVSLTLNSGRMTVADRAIENLELSAKATAVASPSGIFTLSGTVGGKPLRGQATLAPENGRPVMNDLSVSLGENSLTGKLALDEQLRPSGAIRFDFPDVSPLGALALLDAQGSAHGSLTLEVTGGRPVAILDAAIERFGTGDIGASGVKIAATAQDYLGSPTVGGAVTAARVVRGKTQIEDVSVALTQDGEWTSFDGSLRLDGMPAKAKGRVQVAGGRVAVELFEAGTEMRGIAAKLAGQTTIIVADGAVTLDGLTMSAAGGTATISGRAGENLDLDVTLVSLPAAALNSLASGFDAKGTLSGSAKVTGTASAPRVSYQAEWRDGQLAQTRAAGFGTMTVSSTGNLANNVLTFQASLSEASGLGLKGGGSVNVAARTLDVALNGRLPFAFLAPRLAAQGIVLSGGADVALNVAGAFSKPQISGSALMSGARFVHATSGIAIDDLAANLALAGGVATISRLSGTLSTGGTIAGSGTVGIDAAKGFPADLSISLDNGRYTDGRVVTASLDGKIKVTGALASAPLLAGTIDLGRTVVTIPDKLPGSASALNVQHRNAPAAVNRQQAAMKPAGGSDGAGGLNLDLQVNAPQEIIVQGRGLDAELGGSLRLAGPASSPGATGRFDLRRGRLEILGRRLDFASGSIGFAGSLVPYLDMKASTGIEDATVTVTVTGPATDPAFALSSSPALPQDEIFARLIFGKAMSNLSPLQIAQLASAAGQLAGIGGSTSLLQQLRDRTGLDDIDVKTDSQTGDTSVAVGKYLNDKTYLTIEKGSQPGSGKATIDLEIGKGLKLRGEATDNGKTRGGIFYEQDY